MGCINSKSDQPRIIEPIWLANEANATSVDWTNFSRRTSLESCIADPPLRAPVDQPREGNLLGEESLANMEWIRDAAKRDGAYQLLVSTIINGFPDEICDTSERVRPYFGVRSELSEHKGLAILSGCRIVVPSSLRKEVLKRLHVCHQGIERR